MTLSQWLTVHDVSPTVFGRRLGFRSRSTIFRYLSGARTPSLEVQRLIFAATDGAVTPNDWAGLGDAPGADADEAAA